MIFNKYEVVGCRTQLNPNGSDLRCGDKVNSNNWNENEGFVQLCGMCSLKRKNNTLIDMLNRQVKEQSHG